MEGKKKTFNLEALEGLGLEAYREWKAVDDSESRTALFVAIRNLAYGILSVGDWKKYKIVYEDTAYEYALYLFQRLLSGFEFKSTGGQFPLQHYIRLNLKHVVITIREEDTRCELVWDMKKLLDKRKSKELTILSPLEERFEIEYLSKKLLKTLKLYYSISEIRRFWPLAVDLISDKNFHAHMKRYPKDLQDFLIILIASAKKIAAQNGIDQGSHLSQSIVEKYLPSATKSSLFLSTLVNAKFFSNELLLALDLDSLYRLIDVAGGKSIRIPTTKEMDTLLGAVDAVAKIVLEGKSIDEAIKLSQKDVKYLFSSQINMKSFVSNLVNSIDIMGEDKKTVPLAAVLKKGIQAIEELSLRKDIRS